MNKQIEFLGERVFRKISLYVRESWLLSTFFLFFLIVFGVPIIQFLQNAVRIFPYTDLANSIVGFFVGLSIHDWSLLISIITAYLLIFWNLLQVWNAKFVSDYFNSNLNKWNIPLNSDWTIQSCEDKPGNMLCVTQSPLPGTLKPTLSWYDYEIKFETNIKETEGGGVRNPSNFGLVVRSENIANGIMLQFTKTHMIPHVLYEGSFIKFPEEQLPTKLKTNSWIPVRCLVMGNEVIVGIQGFDVRWRIPMKQYSVYKSVIDFRNPSIKEVEDSDNEIKSLFNEVFEKYKEADKEDNVVKKKELKDEADDLLRNIPDYKSISLSYQRGAVGFRQDFIETAYFRRLKVRMIS